MDWKELLDMVSPYAEIMVTALVASYEPHIRKIPFVNLFFKLIAVVCCVVVLAPFIGSKMNVPEWKLSNSNARTLTSMPDVRNEDLQEAKDQLEEIGLRVEILEKELEVKELEEESQKLNQVSDQNIQAGSEVNIGDTVILTVYVEKKEGGDDITESTENTDTTEDENSTEGTDTTEDENGTEDPDITENEEDQDVFIKIKPQNGELVEGDVTFLTVSTSTYEDTEYEIIWSSDDKNIAEVDDQGMVTAIAPGETKIYVRMKDENGNELANDSWIVTVVEKDISKENSSSDSTVSSEDSSEEGTSISKETENSFSNWGKGTASEADMQAIVEYVRQFVRSSKELEVTEVDKNPECDAHYYYEEDVKGYGVNLELFAQNVLEYISNNHNNNGRNCYYIFYENEEGSYRIVASMGI